MTRSPAAAPSVHRTVRYALSGAAMSVALVALTSAGRAAPFVCDNDGNFNFTCGANATTGNSTASTAVGDGADASGATDATAIGASAQAVNFATAVGEEARA